MADRCTRRHVDKQDGQVVIRRVTIAPAMVTSNIRPSLDTGTEQEGVHRARRRFIRKLREATAR